MKRQLYFLGTIITLVIVVSCNKPNSKNDPNPNLPRVAKFFEAFNRHDWDAYADFYAVDAEFLDPTYGKETVRQTRKEIVDKYTGFQRVSPDIKDSVIATYDAGQSVIVEFVAIGTAPDGLKWKLPICSILTFKEGKISRDATYFDEEK